MIDAKGLQRNNERSDGHMCTFDSSGLEARLMSELKDCMLLMVLRAFPDSRGYISISSFIVKSRNDRTASRAQYIL